MKRTLLPLLAVALAAPAARADSTQLVLYHQGRLLDEHDAPVTATVELTMRLYKQAEGGDASAVAWSEKYSVTPMNGAYAIALGDTQKDTKAALTSAQLAGDRWLSVEISGVEMKPRLRIGAVPHAALADEAKHALDADTLGGVAASDYARKSDLPTNALTLQGHPASDFLSATAQAADAAKLGGKDPGAYLLTTAQAADSAKLGGKDPGAYLLTTAQAADSAKLGGKDPSAYLGATAQAADSAKLGGKDPSAYLGASAQAADSAKLQGFVPGDFVQVANYRPNYNVERLLYNFDEGSSGGTSVTDASGAGNRGSFPSSGVLRVTSGHSSTGALTFAAGGGYVTVPDSDSIRISNNITMEAWIYPTAYPASGSEATIMMKELSYGLHLTSSGAVQVAVGTSVAGTWNWWGTTPQVPLNQWTHVVGSYDGVALRIFLNGSLASYVAFPNGSITTNQNSLTIGGRTTIANGSFIGTIDEVRVSAIAKSYAASKATQVLNARAGGLPVTSGSFYTGGGTVLLFASGSGYIGGGTGSQIGMEILVDGNSVGFAKGYTNEIGSHKSFTANFLPVSLAAGSHTLTVRSWNGTLSDTNDFYNAAILELPY